MKNNSMFLLILFNLIFSINIFAASGEGESIGIYFSETGRDYFKDHFQDFLDSNGIQLNNISYPQQRVQLVERLSEEFGSTANEKIEIKKVLSFLRRYLGFTLNSHKIAIDLKGVRFRASWEKIGLEFIGHSSDQTSELSAGSQISVKIILRAKDISLQMSHLGIEDQNNRDLGLIGFRDFVIFQEEGSPALNFVIPLTLYRSSTGFSVEFEPLITNIDDIIVDFNYELPFELPPFYGQIGSKRFELQKGEIEKFIRLHKKEIVSSLKSSVIDFVSSEFPILLEQNINALISDGISETNRMSPPGAPTGEKVEGYLWKAHLNDINHYAGFLHIGLIVDMVDPLDPEGQGPDPEFVARELPSSFPVKKGPYDIIFSMNQGVVNRAIQLSVNRGYFSTIDLENTSINMTKRPILNLKRRYNRSRNYWHKSGTMTIEIEHTVTGLGTILVHNPIRIEFDLKIKFAVEDSGKVSMKVTGVDLGSAYVADKYISWWASKVREGVVSELEKKEKGLKGLVLVDELPIPKSLAGIDIRFIDAVIVGAGHLLVSGQMKKE